MDMLQKELLKQILEQVLKKLDIKMKMMKIPTLMPFNLNLEQIVQGNKEKRKQFINLILIYPAKEEQTLKTNRLPLTRNLNKTSNKIAYIHHVN